MPCSIIQHPAKLLLACLGLLHITAAAANSTEGQSSLQQRWFHHSRVGLRTNNPDNAESQKAKRASEPSKGTGTGGGWTKTADLRGQSLIDFFEFETDNTGPGGIAQYVNQADAFQQGLAQIQDDTVYFRVDQTEHVDNSRKAIRISSKTTFSPGTLLVIDVKHMPVACGAWPAIWTVAKDGTWPDKGEIDIIEGVNMFTHNSMSIHTKHGFSMHPHGFTSGFMMEAENHNNCAAEATNNQGCGLRDKHPDSFGEPFNSAGGGVFVMDWAERAIWINFYPRDSIPDHIKNGSPDRRSPWRRRPRAYFTDTAGQNTGNYFLNHALVINTNLCGDWPEGVWSTDTSYAGQDKSCATITGANSCADFVLHSGSKFGDAFWALNSIQIYSPSAGQS